jgi:hypothetical protein
MVNKMSCSVIARNKSGSTGIVYELPRDTCEKWFGGYRCARVGTVGEGSCFYHSVAFAMNLQNYCYKTTDKERQAIVHAWRKDRFAKTFTKDIYEAMKPKDTYENVIQSIQNPTEWANETHIKHASTILNVNIIFLDIREDSPYCGIHDRRVLYSPGQANVPTIIVAWVNRQHFEPIVRIENTEGLLRTMFIPEDAVDNQFIQAVMKSYADSCKLHKKSSN